jgi:hypothetical protein
MALMTRDFRSIVREVKINRVGRETRDSAMESCVIEARLPSTFHLG